MRRVRWWIGAVVGLLLLGSSVGGAAVDMTGGWRLTIEFLGLSFPMLVTQSGTTLSATISFSVGVSSASGAFDPDTGAFTLAGRYVVRPGIPEAPPEVTCHYRISATVSADGRTFAGTHDDDCGLHRAVSGVRDTCGNGVLDPGEVCDAASPCCTPTCDLATAGTACPDANPCTDDACDASGVCQHTPNTAPCDASGCTSATCAAGVCVPGEPAPAGTSCADDTSSCTLHACDGSGGCVATPRQCPACETCFNGGCIATPEILCGATSVQSVLDVRISAAGKRRLRWSFTGRPAGLFPTEFGDPRVGTQYDLCVYLVSAAGTHTAAGTVSAGGACGGRPCWSARRGGFRYDSRINTAGGGIRTLRLIKMPDGVHRLFVSGVGPALDLPGTLGLSSALVQLVASGSPVPACWQADFAASIVNQPTHFRARH